jgi:predicted ATP-grasp superfamily ATP-dependent carboligase
MEHVRWSSRPTLRAPVLIAAFTGWNDAGDAASGAVRHLIEAWRAEPVAALDPEEFYDFGATRPLVRLAEGVTREIVWPPNDIWAASTPGSDVVLLLGTEPQLKWRTFCRQITAVAAQQETSLVLTLGALLADVAHSRPVSLIGTATDQGLIDRFRLARSRYEGPTGIVGALHDACAGAGLPSASLWAAVPAYAPGINSPKAALALVERAAAIVGAPVSMRSLENAVSDYEDEVAELVAADDDLAGYVGRLESLSDVEDDDDDDEEEERTAPDATVEQFVEDVERFLRDQGRD